MRLEDLVEDPEAELRRVLDFVDEPWDDSVLDPERRDASGVPPFPWFQDALTSRDAAGGGAKIRVSARRNAADAICGSAESSSAARIANSKPLLQTQLRENKSRPLMTFAGNI